MDLFITTLESVAVLLGIGVIGFFIIQKKVLSGNILDLLSPLALDIALPSLIFISIINNFEPAENPEWWQLPLWWLFFTVIALGLTFVFSLISKKKSRREFAVSLFYQNGIFFPLAILAGIFGDSHPYVSYLFIFTIFYAAMFFSTYYLFLEKKGKNLIKLKKIFHPVLIVTIIALAIRLSGSHEFVPDVAIKIFTLLGGMTIPLLMIILGGNIFIDFQKKGKIYSLEIVKFVLIKNILFPLIFLGIILVIKPILTYPIALIILLQSAVPPVTAVPLVTERAGGDRTIVDQFLVASFILSLISIPVMILLLDVLFTSG
jgi:malate permease and related proteins